MRSVLVLERLAVVLILVLDGQALVLGGSVLVNMQGSVVERHRSVRKSTAQFLLKSYYAN